MLETRKDNKIWQTIHELGRLDLSPLAQCGLIGGEERSLRSALWWADSKEESQKGWKPE